MGGNKKGHRVATVARKREEFPSTGNTVERERCYPTLCRTYCFSSQNSQARCASSALGDLRGASGPRRAGDQSSAVTSAGIPMDVLALEYYSVN